MQQHSGLEPGTLIRTPAGRITFWSEQLEQRYGFSESQALGQVAHELLRTSHWQARNEIDSVLATHSEWRGGMVAYHADDGPMIVANHWHLHRGADALDSLVTEVHADIVTFNTSAADELADVVTTFALELSQPLTALSGFIGGTRRAAQSPWPDRNQVERGLSEAAAQLDRASSIVARIRALGQSLSDPRLRALHARFEETVRETERLKHQSRNLRTATTVVWADSAALRQQSGETRDERRHAARSGEIPVEQALALQSIQVYRRQLASLRSQRVDMAAERLLTQLLQDEEAKLAALERETVGRE